MHDATAPSAPAREYDRPLVVITVLLLAFGLMAVWSASAFVSAEETKDAFHFVTRQLAAIGIGVILLWVAMRLPYRQLHRWAPTLYAASVVLLLAVWIPGLAHSANGAQRWIGLAGINFQPAELAKASVLVGLASWLHRHRNNIHDFRNVLLPAGVGIAVPLVLIICQPDFGSFAIISLLCGMMLVFAGLRLGPVAILGGIGALVLGVIAVAEPYRWARITSFLDPFENCSGSAYQVCESLLALHHGGLWGQGLGDGVAKLLYLPEPYNDFIAAVVGEELGIWGFSMMTGLYIALAWRGFSIARRAPDMFGALLASTLTVMIVGQACLNLGVVLSVVPPKGLVLPFVSYGASAMMINLGAVGLLLSISADGREAEAPVPVGRPVAV